MTYSNGSKALLILWLLTLTTAGCATDGGIKPPFEAPTSSTDRADVDASSAVDLAFKYRQETAELRNEARRLELEAEFYSKHQDQEDLDRAKHYLGLAREMRKAADVTDEKARDYRAQVPHTRVN